MFQCEVLIESFLRREIDVGSFPSAVYAVGSSRGITGEGAVGNAVAVPLRLPAALDTIYDCASLTKPLITTTLILQSVKNLDERFHGYTFRELLTHTSGLRAWLPLYAYKADYLDTILKEGPEYPRDRKVVYSDLNFILLWYALRELGLDFAVPLQIADAMFNPPAWLRPRIAATEWGQRYEAKMANLPAPRDGLIWGETHDGNAFFAGGTAGNAGLFATARAVFRMAQAWVNAEVLPLEIVKEATRNHTPDLDDARGFGWQMPTGSEATKMLSPRAFGHTGFTGTSLWIDPDRDRIMVLLTNRVHPCAAPINIQRIRGEFHRLALAT
ncbi:MAG TPA: serine hydrolase domain-containing protein [Thermoanaerobaculia bacterium]